MVIKNQKILLMVVVKKSGGFVQKAMNGMATINNRTSSTKAGCPFCTGKKVCEDNNLLNMYPEIAKEWHPKKNKKLTPRDVTRGSGKKIWWICSKGHEWNAVVFSRTYGRGCPYCSRK